jgi:ATP/maltotriose-dependent transcriptional regulator MalT
MTAIATQHDVRDYLAREVLDHQPPHVRDVLLETRVLDRLSADIYAAIDEVVRRQVRADHADHVQTAPPVELLTGRELEVLGLVAAGLANREIADDRVVVVDTVKKHVSHVLRKLSADNRTQAVARARALGLLA